MNRDYHDAVIDQLLREILGGDRPRDMTARVLAQARLMDRFRRRNWWLSGLAAAAVVALAACLTMYWPHEYPAFQAEGVAVQVGARLERGAELVSSESDGGTVKLGGYVDIAMAPQTTLRIGVIIGMLIWKSVRQNPAPSLAAASGISFGIAVRPASMMTVENGISRQQCTRTTDAIARCGSPSHIGAA